MVAAGGVLRAAPLALASALLLLQAGGGDAQFTRSAGGENLDGSLDHCNFSGTVRLKGPYSMEPGDAYFSTAHQQRAAVELFITKLNNQHCGVSFGGHNYTVEITSVQDSSSTAIVEEIAKSIVADDTIDFVWGPYSTTLNKPYASVIAESSKLAVLAGASSTAVFQGRPNLFGTLPASPNFFRYAVPALKTMNATRFAYVSELDAPMCGYVEQVIADFGVEKAIGVIIPKEPSEADVFGAVDEIIAEDPDVILTCVYNNACPVFVKGLRDRAYTPKALVMSLCPGTSGFLEAVGADAENIMGVTAWDKSLDATDAIINMTAEEFFYEIRDRIGADAVYHTAASAGAISALVQAIQRADSIDPAAVAAELKLGGFQTVFGEVNFDNNNQFRDPYLLVQYDKSGNTPVIWPKNGLEMVYPMPTWQSQDCRASENCSDIGECQSDGSCLCPGDYEPSGYKCIIIPNEDHQQSPQVKAVCLALFAVNWIISMSAIAWTIHYRRKPVIRASQPVFLVTIAIGTMISSSTILFLIVDDVNDPSHLAESGEYWPATMACRMMLVTYTSGFVLTFAPLFAKLWRVKALMASAKTLKRIRIRSTWLFFLIGGLIVIDLAIVFAWNVNDPLVFSREIISYDENGSPTLSAGACGGNDEMPFIVAILIFHLSMLFFGVYLCFKTRNINSVMSESKYVAVAMISNLQVLALATPVLVIVSGEPVASMFLRSAVIFLNDFGVLNLIFLPKVIALVRGDAIVTSGLTGSSGSKQTRREGDMTTQTGASGTTVSQ